MNFNRAFTRTTSSITTMALAICAALGTVSVTAADKTAKRDDPKFDRLDKNRDGVLTMDELRHIRDYATPFVEADDNKDGKLDKDEFIKAEFIHSRIVAGKYISDSVLTAKVKAALLKEPDLKSLDVSVETLRGEVLLSGFVTDENQRAKAMRTAIAVDGVTAVKDLLLVR